MTTVEKMAVIGKIVLLADSTRSMAYEVEIVDSREVWGRTQFLVKPINGSGDS